MPRFPDATGYLLELRDTVGENWFNSVTDMAVASAGNEPTVEQLVSLWSHFHGLATYTPAAVAVPAVGATAGAPLPAHFLVELSSFNGFKKLASGMRVDFCCQLTLIFGKNGSGKSSLCQTLKLLANPDRPSEPLHNVRADNPGTPSFAYMFRGSPAASTWSEAAGFGSQAQAIKYFDSTVALNHATGNLQPRSVVEVSAFRLEAFDYAGRIVSRFQTYARNRVSEGVSRLQFEIETAKQRLSEMVDTAAHPFDQWSATTSLSLANYLAALPEFGVAKIEKLAELTRAIAQYTAASSDEGLRSLRAQYALLDQLATHLTTLSNLCESAPLAILQTAEADVNQKRAASIELSRGAFHSNVNAQLHHALIHATAAMYDLSAFKAGEHICPLCRQAIGAEAEALFKDYHDYLTSTLQNQISTLEATLQNGRAALERVRSFRLSDFSACSDLLSEGMLESIVSSVEAVVGAVPPEDQPLATGDSGAYSRAERFVGYISAIRNTLAILDEAIKTGTENRQDIVNRISSTKIEIASLQAHRAICEARENMVELCERSSALAPLDSRVSEYNFAGLLRSMTMKGKEAHRDLVLATFEQRLSDEYQRLCGASLEQMGVRLADRGDQQDVIVTPHVGNTPVYRVLSEGELKVHALAVFMCEAVAAPHRVLVFDDPATSFDYNYVSNFCERLRDVVRDQPQTQVIVLTHNWDFFVNLQTTINRSPGLNARMSVQVLEDCATVREYSEDWDRLCNEIAPIIAGPAEPAAAEKEQVAGLMRRLVERLTNKHVFNEQRHQFKPKSLQVSEFRSFTKLVPLYDTEADKLKDIFANLSPPEHDDPRNFYTSRSRAQFRTWFDEIHTIKAALESRRP